MEKSFDKASTFRHHKPGALIPVKKEVNFFTEHGNAHMVQEGEFLLFLGLEIRKYDFVIFYKAKFLAKDKLILVINTYEPLEE